MYLMSIERTKTAERNEERFGELVRGLIERSRLSQSQMWRKAGHGFNPSLYTKMVQGHVPKYDTLSRAMRAFPDEDVVPVFLAAGYQPPAAYSSDAGAEYNRLRAEFAARRGIEDLSEAVIVALKEALEK